MVVGLLCGTLVATAVRADLRLFKPGPPSPVIFPDQTIPLRFNHGKHVAKGIRCVTCHANIPKSMFGKDRNIPNGQVCDTCHGTDHDEYKPGSLPTGEKIARKCSFCHPGYKGDGKDVIQKMDFPVPNLKFNHKIHIDNKFECSVCHGDFKNVTIATREGQLPKMNDCLKCHDGRKAPSACGTCHLVDRDDRLVQNFPQGKLLPTQQLRGASHDIEWSRNHRLITVVDRKLCQNCHSESFCLDCHNQTYKPLSIHPNDWIHIHPVAARKNDPNCTSCHRLQSFCIACHERSLVGVRPTGSPGAFRQGGTPGTNGAGRFHPNNWVSPGGRSLHPQEAQKNIRACVSCHRESFCMSCHATRARQGADPSRGIGSGVFAGQSPHPSNWVASGRCKALATRNYRVCLKCHVPDDMSLRMCL
jgi:hypothetical protein